MLTKARVRHEMKNLFAAANINWIYMKYDEDGKDEWRRGKLTDNYAWILPSSFTIPLSPSLLFDVQFLFLPFSREINNKEEEKTHFNCLLFLNLMSAAHETSVWWWWWWWGLKAIESAGCMKFVWIVDDEMMIRVMQYEFSLRHDRFYFPFTDFIYLINFSFNFFHSRWVKQLTDYYAHTRFSQWRFSLEKSMINGISI